MKTKQRFATREEWLTEAMGELWAVLGPHTLGGVVGKPPAVKVSCGFPLKRKGKGSHALGQCWCKSASKGETFEIFVCPTQADPVEVLAILLHEFVHAAVGLECGHKGAFKRVAMLCGLEGKMTATVPGEGLRAILVGIAGLLGVYPHRELVPTVGTGPKKDSTRLLKVWCPSCDYTVRVSRKWIDVGLPLCPCGCVMTWDEDTGEPE